MCGEKGNPQDYQTLVMGSPPRVRGKGTCDIRFFRRGGITPACAGKSPPRCPGGTKSWDHPRVCGEKHRLQSSDCTFSGSPPRVRGKAFCTFARARWAGITPACAGKSLAGRDLAALHQDHPRVCGEKLMQCMEITPTAGSPPRVRGKARSTIPTGTALGITPACAGKSEINHPDWYGTGDHPRVCGEKWDKVWISAIFTGSPPRVRGKDIIKAVTEDKIRITPACAGKRPLAMRPKIGARDHPRVCGEKTRGAVIAWLIMGSPPRVRGKVHVRETLPRGGGITPACAGKRSGS